MEKPFELTDTVAGHLLKLQDQLNVCAPGQHVYFILVILFKLFLFLSFLAVKKIPSPPLPDHPCSASLLSHTYVHVCRFTHIRKHIDSAQLPSGNTPHLAGICLMLTQRNIRPSLQFSPHPNDTVPKSPTVTHILLHVQYSIPDIEASVLLSVHEHLYLSVVRSVGLYMGAYVHVQAQGFSFSSSCFKALQIKSPGKYGGGAMVFTSSHPLSHRAWAISCTVCVCVHIFSSEWYDVQTEFLLHKINNLLCLCL